jgi:hypothetical protein
VLLTTGVPGPGSDGIAALRAAVPAVVSEVVDLLAADAPERLGRRANGAA